MVVSRKWLLTALLCGVAVVGLFHAPFVEAKRSSLSEAEIKRLWEESAESIESTEVSGAFPYIGVFREASQKHKVPLPLLLAVARGESNFNAKAESTRDCYGIMQIRWPGTAKDLGFTRKEQLFDPRRNINAGAKYVAMLTKMFGGNLYKAVAAYNYGPGTIQRSATTPQGAQWYAHYIHRHLQSVVAGPFVKTDRVLLLEFTYYGTASRYLDFVQEQLPGVSLEIFRSNKYTFDVCVIYKNEEDRGRYLAELRKIGIKPLRRSY